MPPSGDHWTAERVAELRKRWAADEPTRSIGRAMNLTNNQVVGKAHRLRLPSRGSPLGYKVWTRERHAKALELRDGGVSLSQIAATIGVDTESVRKWLRLGIEAIAAKVQAGSTTRLKPTKPAPAPVKRHATRVTVRPKSQPLPEQRIVAPKPAPAEIPLSKHAKCQFPAWPHGARRGHPDFGRFCAAPAALGRSYCPACCAVAYRAEAA